MIAFDGNQAVFPIGIAAFFTQGYARFYESVAENGIAMSSAIVF